MEAGGGSDGFFMDFQTGLEDGLVGCEFVTSDAVCKRALETGLTRNTRGFAKLVFVGCASDTSGRIA
jgi:hypothetical protein